MKIQLANEILQAKQENLTYLETGGTRPLSLIE
jgi:hypothetical protein